MRLDELLRRSSGEIAGARLCVSDIELESAEELLDAYFVPLLNKVLAALNGNHFETFALLMNLLEVVGLGGRPTTGADRIGGSHSAHSHIDTMDGIARLFKALATPLNVASLHHQRKFAAPSNPFMRVGGGASGSNIALPTSVDSISCIAEILQLFIGRLGAIVEVSAAMEESAKVSEAHGQVTHSLGMGDYMLGGSTRLGDAVTALSHTLEAALTPSVASVVSDPFGCLEALGVFLNTVVLPLSGCSLPSGSKSQICTPQHLATVKEAFGQFVMPLLFNLIEMLQQLMQSKVSCGLLKICGGGIDACWQMLAALHQGNASVSRPRNAGQRGVERADALTSSPSPLSVVLTSARDCASAVILLLKGSKENKKRLYTHVDGAIRFTRVRGSDEGVDEYKAALHEAFVDYQRDSATLLGRLLLPHPPLSVGGIQHTEGPVEGYDDDGHSSLVQVLVPSLLTSCLDSYLQLQLCEIVLRARMYKVDAFQRLFTFRRFDASAFRQESVGGGSGKAGNTLALGDNGAGVDGLPTDEWILSNGSGPLVYYEQLDTLLSQLPVTDAATLFGRMRDMLRDLNEFAISDEGCEAVAAIVPPISLRDLVLPEARRGARSKGTSGARGVPLADGSDLLPCALAKRLIALVLGDNSSMIAALKVPVAPHPPNAIGTFEVLRVETCFMAGGSQHATAPFSLFNGASTTVHFSSSFMVMEVPSCGDRSDVGAVESITVPYDTVRSVRLSRDKTVLVFRLDGGLGLWRAEERGRRRQQEREERGKRARRAGGEDECNLENSFAVSAFDEEYSHVFNLGPHRDDEDVDHAVEDGPPDEDDDDDVSPRAKGLGRVPLCLQRGVIRSATALSTSLAGLRRVLGPAIIPISEPTGVGGRVGRMPDITVHLVMTRATMGAIMAVGVHKRIERLRGSFGMGVGIARGDTPLLPRQSESSCVQPPAEPANCNPSDDGQDTKRHRVEHQGFPSLTKVIAQPLDLVPQRESALPFHVGSGSVPSISVAEAELERRTSIAHSLSRQQSFAPSHPPADVDPPSGGVTTTHQQVLQMVSDVLDEQSVARQRQRRLDILTAHSEQIQAYIDAYRSESRVLEDAYASDINARLQALRTQQRQFNSTVRSAVGELNEGVEILRGVEESLTQKLGAVEGAFEAQTYVRGVKEDEMNALIGIKTIVDASVRSMESFLEQNISGSNPLKILEDFVEKQRLGRR